MSETELITPTQSELERLWMEFKKPGIGTTYPRLIKMLHAFQRDYPRQAPQPEPAPKTTGMTFSEALEAMKRGERVRMRRWGSDGWIILKKDHFVSHIDMKYVFCSVAVLATDWEIYQEPKPKTARQIAEEEFEVWWKDHVVNGFSDGSIYQRNLARPGYLAAKGIKEGAE